MIVSNYLNSDLLQNEKIIYVSDFSDNYYSYTGKNTFTKFWPNTKTNLSSGHLNDRASHSPDVHRLPIFVTNYNLWGHVSCTLNYNTKVTG